MPTTMREVVALAKRAAAAEPSPTLHARHMLAGAFAHPEARRTLASQITGGETITVPGALRGLVDRIATTPEVEARLPLGDDIREPFQRLWAQFSGFPPFADFARELALVNDPLVAELRGMSDAPRTGTGTTPSADVGQLVEIAGGLQNILARKVIGQRQAARQIADAVFQARLFHRSGDATPAAVLLFLGPPGVGKTYTAQLVARALYGDDEAHFLRLDMSSYADPESFRMLVGFEPSYQGARPGRLTEWVTAHPRSLILIDEVEKAHPVVHNLFLQVLDRGQLEDKYTKDNASFGETIIIFTTNLGKELYATGAAAGPLASVNVSRAAVLEALRNAPHPLTGRPALSPEMCSRLAKGYPILFNHLTPGDLEQIARLAVEELSAELEARRGIRVVPPEPRLLTLMILRLGPDLDARMLTSGIPLMLLDAYHEATRSLEDPGLLDQVRSLRLELPTSSELQYFERMYEGGEQVLLVTGSAALAAALSGSPLSVRSAPSTDAAIELCRRERPDMILLDAGSDDPGDVALPSALRRLRSAHPDVPILLLAPRPLTRSKAREDLHTLADGCAARGILEGPVEEWPPGADSPLEASRRALRREAHLREHFRSRQSVHFTWDIEVGRDPSPVAIDKGATIILRPRDIHTQTVVASKDRTARLTFAGIPKERFADVAGAREAKRRLREVISWLRDPGALRSLGVDLPAGVLLEGPPGNGKTLLARATAGEANLPFFAASATDFASKWVGESEANVRELFERAATYAPSILFIDEIDAIGARRAMEHSSVSDAMLNQLLVSMDGFARRDRPVFFLAATNRSELLDPALKRPGRFDLIISIDDLDLDARAELLTRCLAGVPHSDDVATGELARASIGMSGAQLAQVVKEAAIQAFREHSEVPGNAPARVEMRHLREALTTVRYGLRREGAAPAAADLLATAYHEAGHALVAELERPGSVHQVTVLPRGRALGFVESLPESENHSLTVKEVFSRIRVALAGRAAEILIFGADNASAGCSQDLEQATRLAALSVTRFGMSKTFGPLSLPVLDQLLPGCDAARRADAEVAAILRAQEEIVNDMLEQRRATLDALANTLVARETLDGGALADLVRAADAAQEEA